MLSFQALSSTKLYQLRNLKHDWLADLKKNGLTSGGKGRSKDFSKLAVGAPCLESVISRMGEGFSSSCHFLCRRAFEHRMASWRWWTQVVD